MSHVQVAVATPLKQLFTYNVPDGMSVSIGSRVFVPFGRRNVVGYVMSRQGSEERDIKIKDIIDSPDNDPVFTSQMVELLKWMSDYYCLSIGEICKAALPSFLTKEARKVKRRALSKETMVDDGIFSSPFVTLTSDQEKAYKELSAQLNSGCFKTTLLHGITGSGKTEVYLRLFQDVIASGKEGIFLVPEIGMTPQAVGRLTSRFGNKVAVYHSSLTDARRLYEWERMKKGEARIVIGTRSAIFAPFKNLGLIVVDEEHDPSYKQDENPRYNGRDASVMRAKLENIPCLLGSATPSVESYSNAKNDKYGYIHLPARPTGAPLPEVSIVDMKEVPKGASLSPQLINAISETISKKEQTMLFLNKRGFASFVLCPDCGETFTCPNCNITLTYHRSGDVLMCHYCEYKIKAQNICPCCKGNNVRAFGTGTEKIETELKEYFPDARIARLDRDSVEKAGERPKILTDMKLGNTDILIGTQMITKGHDFPNVTLVGVIDADASLNFPDFRSAERTFQLITQVAGRSGRSDKTGRVIVQTFAPEHYAIKASIDHDFFGFFEEEINNRKELGYPPFGRVALIRLQGIKDSLVSRFADEIAAKLSVCNDKRASITVLGPSPSPIARVRNNFRWQILVRSGDIKRLTGIVSAVSCVIPPRGVKLSIDMDAVNMM